MANELRLRHLGATLADGIEYDPFFVEICRLVNAIFGVTCVSLSQGSATDARIFNAQSHDIVLAFAVWVNMQETLEVISQVAPVMVFETHTLDDGARVYLEPILQHFTRALNLGYTDKPRNLYKSRAFMVFGRDAAAVNAVVQCDYLKIQS